MFPCRSCYGRGYVWIARGRIVAQPFIETPAGIVAARAEPCPENCQGGIYSCCDGACGELEERPRNG